MKSPLAWSLFYGIFPAVITVVGALAAVFLLARRDRPWFSHVVPAVLLLSLGLVFLVRWIVDDLWHPFPDPLPITVLTWTGVTFVGVGLAFSRLRSAGWIVRAVSILAAFLIFLMSIEHVNTFFGYYPNLRDVLGLPLPNQGSETRLLASSSMSVEQNLKGPIANSWKPTGRIPKGGRVFQATIPGLRSHFQARPAWVYLPPAYLMPHRPLLPVLELVEGQPGNPRDWLDGGELASLMDNFASHHRGLAPVVVMPDDLGSFFANPLCMNSRLGNDDTYLAVDVPNWVRKHVDVDPNTRYWAVGGPSYGGTCALQLAVLHPRLFPTFIDIAGQYQQTLGTAQETVNAAFGGNYVQFAKVNPIEVLAHHTRKLSWGTIAVGGDEPGFVVQSQMVAAFCRRADMHIRFLELPGGHSWVVWSQILGASLDWLGHRQGLIKA